MINRRLKCSNEEPVSEIFLVEEYTVTGLLCQWKVMDTKQNGGQMIKCLICKKIRAENFPCPDNKLGVSHQYMSSVGISGTMPASFASGFSATIASVVRSSPATEAAFCRANRVTLVGSMTPASRRSSYLSLSAL